MTGWQTALHRAMSRWLKVPPQPNAPAGSPESIRIFRAGQNFLRLKQWQWGVKQVALIVFALVFAGVLHGVGAEHQVRRSPIVVQMGSAADWIGAAILAVHLLPLVVELLSMPFTYALVWLNYDQRWYLATDRSLRIREGIWRVREMTLTFANIQQITVQQGPLQRLLGIADLVVTTAGGGGGGGGSGHAAHPGHEPVHTGYLRGVDNAGEIRDLILARMRALKDAGLGDPDDREPGVELVPPPLPSTSPTATPQATLQQAADAMLQEARELRAEVERG